MRNERENTPTHREGEQPDFEEPDLLPLKQPGRALLLATVWKAHTRMRREVIERLTAKFKKREEDEDEPRTKNGDLDKPR
jgi:hypothetical protein